MTVAVAKHKPASLKKQHGQAAVFVVLFSAIMLVAVFSLFKAGKITTNKMQLQNAADAAVYSMSVVEARDLNFASYMNRAIVANEVAIAQFVGLASWAFHFKSFAEYLNFYNTCCLGPATLGATIAPVNAVTGPWIGVGSTATRLMSKLANVVTIVLHNINKVYGIAQFGYHTVSVLLAVGVLDDVITDNGPPGTKISDFGILSLIAHAATYGVLPGLPGDQFATGYLPTTKTDVADFNEENGYARLSALIRDSRDPFTVRRDWAIPLIPRIDVSTPETFPFWVDAGVIAWESGFRFWLEFALERKGGSELRILLPDSGDAKVGQLANWSSADTTGLALDIGGSGYIRLYVLPEPFRQKIFDGRLGLSVGNGSLVLSASFGGADPVDPADCEDANETIEEDNESGANDPALDLNDCSAEAPGGKEILRIEPFPTEMPFGAGFSEVTKTADNDIKLDDMALDPAGPITIEMYGKSAESLLAWMMLGVPSPQGGVSPPPGIWQSSDLPTQAPPLHQTKVSKGYGGLPMYVDTTGEGPFLGVGAPNILIGLVQDETDYDTYFLTKNNLGDDYATADSNEPGGRLKVNEAFAGNTPKLAVIAKSELYFSRPTDRFASHFFRDDGLTEVGSAFNPYWQARLVDTSYADRVVALGIQQQQDFVNLPGSIDTLISKFSGIFPF